VHGFAFGLATTFLLALLIEVRPQDESAAPTMAWYTAAISLGYALGAPLAGQTIERFGYTGAFLISGLVGFAGAALSLAMRPMNEVAPTVGQARQPAAVLPSHGWRSLARLPAGIWLATMLVFYINFVSDANGAFFPIYAVGAGISVGTVGFLKSLHSVVGTCLRFAAVGLFRLVDAGLVNHLSVVAMALATIALSILTHEVALAVVFVVLGACRGLIRVTSATMVAEERKRPGVDVGMASGVYNAGLDAGTMLGPPVAGALAGIMDIPRMFRVVALVLPALYYVVWLAQRARASRPAIVGTRVAS
jgi:predicted MFS family arabinose efflux permease